MKSAEPNRVVSPYTAIVDGKRTGLAGCSVQCPRRYWCLRSDSTLAMRVAHQGGQACVHFIPAST